MIAALGGLFMSDVVAMAQPPRPMPPGPACLRQREIYDFQPVAGNRSLVVIDRSRQRYRLTFMGICSNLQYHLGLGFKTFGAGTLSCVAKGDSVLLRDVVGPNKCIIKDIQYQTPAMDQADAAAAAAAKQR
jgi:hypothetical protein